MGKLAAPKKPMEVANRLGPIRTDERDISLFATSKWPPALGSAWQITAGDASLPILPYRSFSTDDAPAEVPLVEFLSRFPSAPLYAISRKPIRVGAPAWHSLRILRRWARPRVGADDENDVEDVPVSATIPESHRRIRRIYLLNNGLNETFHAGVYYEIAQRLLKHDPFAACILRPFPNHLTRYPFTTPYAEAPLDRYLSDPGELFRNFLRFMLEMQWLVSVLAPLPRYRMISGVPLLGDGIDGTQRSTVQGVTEAITRSWESAYEASSAVRARHPHWPPLPPPLEIGFTKEAVASLRSILGWSPQAETPPPYSVEGPTEAGPASLAPALHALGYSLGGFTAQCTFFLWPYAFATCTTLCSGGALRDARLEKVAHPEEWQRVMSAVRYEIKNALLQGYVAIERERVGGINADLFANFYRVFCEVFLGDVAPPYRARLSEYVARMLFVVGGRDPIITPQNVINARPEGGLNMIEIADLPHFLSKKYAPDEWKHFWFKEVCHVTRKFAGRGESLLHRMLVDNWASDDYGSRRHPHKAEDSDHPRESHNEPLNADQLDRALAESLDRTQTPWVFIARNRVPAALSAQPGESLVQQGGAALFYSDRRAWPHIETLAGHARMLDAATQRRRLTLILPADVGRWYVKDREILSVKPPAALGRRPTADDRRRGFDGFRTRWHGVTRGFDPDPSKSGLPAGVPSEVSEAAKTLRAQVRDACDLPKGTADLRLVNTLPETWTFIEHRVMRELARDHLNLRGEKRPVTRDDSHRILLSWGAQLATDRKRVQRGGRSAGPMADLERYLSADGVRIIRISRAELNPGFRGWRILEPDEAARAIINLALGFASSRPGVDPPPDARTSDELEAGAQVPKLPIEPPDQANTGGEARPTADRPRPSAR